MLRVGVYATGAAGAPVTLAVFDASNVLIETLVLPTVAVSAWATNFLGLQRSEGIRYVEGERRGLRLRWGSRMATTQPV